MSKTTTALIERERVRHPKRLARFEARLARLIFGALELQAHAIAATYEQSNRKDVEIVIATTTSAIASALFKAGVLTWREFDNPDKVDTKAASDVPVKIAKQIKADAKESAGMIEQSTRGVLNKIIAEHKDEKSRISRIAAAIRSRLGGAVARRRAKRIAGTETVRVANDAATTGARDAGMKFKIWTTASDERVRECHQSAHGQKQPLAGLFNICGDNMRFPGDRTYGPKPGNIINCRCHCVYTRR